MVHNLFNVFIEVLPFPIVDGDALAISVCAVQHTSVLRLL